MTDTTDAALDALVAKATHYSDYALAFENPRIFDAEGGKLEGALVFQSVKKLLDKLADAITALRAERDATMTAERDAAYARGVHDAAEMVSSCMCHTDWWLNDQSVDEEELADAIRALAKAPPAHVVKVWPLAWHPGHGCTAYGLGIQYAMCETTPGLFAMTCPFHSEKDLPQSEMQALGQADYEARVLAELLPQEKGGNS